MKEIFIYEVCIHIQNFVFIFTYPLNVSPTVELVLEENGEDNVDRKK